MLPQNIVTRKAELAHLTRRGMTKSYVRLYKLVGWGGWLRESTSWSRALIDLGFQGEKQLPPFSDPSKSEG
jgi:hypothetical protein